MYKIIDEHGILHDSSPYYPRQGHFEFYNVTRIEGAEIDLLCTNRKTQRWDTGAIPAYIFDIMVRKQAAGRISLRVGFNESIYYGGHIGYSVDESFRGNAYALKACGMLKDLAILHGLRKLIITVNPDNYPSRRTCEKLGCMELRTVDLPMYNELYRMGERQKVIYEWDLG